MTVADLFHVTRVRDARQIAQQGLLRSAMTVTEKQSRDAVPEDERDNMAMFEDPPDVLADREFDDTMAQAKRAVESAAEYPSHGDAVFFWTDESRAWRAEKDTAWSGAVVGVDRDRLPDGCRPARGDIEIADTVWHHHYDMFRDHASGDREDAYEEAKRFWRGVSWYEGQSSRTDEVWVDCDVPPDAIEFIRRPGESGILWEPAAKDQRTLSEWAED